MMVSGFMEMTRFVYNTQTYYHYGFKTFNIIRQRLAFRNNRIMEEDRVGKSD